MSLRARLLIVLGVVLVIYAVAAVIVVSTQRAVLTGQVDDQLAAVTPGDVRSLPDLPSGPPGGTVSVTNGVRGAPFSNLSIGRVDREGATILLESSLSTDIPDFASAVQLSGGAPGTVTIDAVGDGPRYRARVMPQPVDGTWLVAARALVDVDAAVARLERTLWIAGGIIALILGVAAFWVQRLGLRPIARVTATAGLIAAGDRSSRVDVTSTRTEAGQLGHAFNVMLDERDAAENRLKQFVADASHELRTPLTSVRGYLELYQQGAFREKGQLDDVVRRLSAEATRMHGLVEDLLSLASLDEERPLRVTRVDAGQLLRDAAQDATAMQPERRIVVRLPDVGPMVAADQALLVQLVGILVANALTHTPVSATVTLSAERNDATVAIRVADDGPGLAPEVAEHVFDRFWRGEAGRSRREGSAPSGSSGLGLAIAQSIVDAHDGTITLRTAPGEGCAFTVRLPLDRDTTT